MGHAWQLSPADEAQGRMPPFLTPSTLHATQ